MSTTDPLHGNTSTAEEELRHFYKKIVNIEELAAPLNEVIYFSDSCCSVTVPYTQLGVKDTSRGPRDPRRFPMTTSA